MIKENYNAESIEILSGLEPVQKRPGMYTDTSRPDHLAQEVIDNSVDEAIAGYAKTIQVTLYQDHSIKVEDNGRGIPIDIHPDKKINVIELILCQLHTGGKFSNKNYQFSGGLHGVGISVVNALSKKIEVIVHRNGKIYKITFKNGKKTQKLKNIGKCEKKKTGTIIHFWPNPDFFDNPKFSVSRLTYLLKSKAILCPNIEILFIDKINKNKKKWQYKNGLITHLKESVKNSITIPKNFFIGNFHNETEQINWAMTWFPKGGNLLNESYVNLIPTTQGGTHVNGLKNGLLKAIKEFCIYRNLLPRGIKITNEDVLDKCSYILSIKIQDPQFNGQTKEKLSLRRSTIFVSKIIKDSLILWLNQNIKEANKLVELIIHHAKKRILSLKKISRKKIINGPSLPGKLSDCTSQNLNNNELFLVEGDSAGGSAKQARDREYQAIMPLRGKILNTWEVSSEEVLSSQEINDISIAIGIEPNTNNLKQLRYGKICILADADSDGLHIATLLCGLFVRHFLSIVKNGHLYVAMPPLYRIDFEKKVFYALDEEEKNIILNNFKKKNKKPNVQRFKGLGEMNPTQLRETTMDPNTRRLVQLIINEENYKKTIGIIDMLLTKKRANDRRNWLQNKGDKAII